jgi:hypothetical protein
VSDAERMFRLFTGCELGHGTYRREEKSPGRVKTEIKKTARTVREPTTVSYWEQHLSGERSLGVIPIRTDGSCYWGVIDVDEYDLSHRDIAENLAKFQLPMVVCRSKSGGAHIFLFLNEPVQAEELIAKLRDIAAAMGYGGSEIFPKQTELLVEKGDLGNWLNMPYFDAENGTRYAVDSRGRGMSLSKFLDVAEKQQLTYQQFQDLTPARPSHDGDLSDGPPCLEHLASVGVSEGGRNNALFAFGVLAKKMSPDGWEPMLEKWNQRYISPPLSSDEVSIVLKSLRKKEYSYQCKQTPICNHCDFQVCRTRRYGIGMMGGGTPQITSISYLDTEPPLYFVSLASGGTVECRVDEILASRLFQRAVLTQIPTKLVPMYKQDAWLSAIQPMLDSATAVDAPSNVSATGAFREMLETFLADRYKAVERDEILLGKPYFSEDHNRYEFRLADLMSFLERVKFRELTRPQVTRRLQQLGGQHKFVNLRGRGVNLWFLPPEAIEEQTEPLSVPSSDKAPI